MRLIPLWLAVFLLTSLGAVGAPEASSCTPGDSKEACRIKVQLAYEALFGNVPKTTGLFRDACFRAKDAVACSILAGWASSLKVEEPKKPEEILSIEMILTLEASCRKGDAYACAGAGDAYAQGISVKASHRQELEFYRLGCAAGNRESCASASSAYLDEASGLRDTAKAAEYAELGCAKHDAVGCTQLAFVLLATDGGKNVRPRALELFSAACEVGAGAGCNGAGWMDENGYATAMSAPRAEILFERGCILGNAHACKNLGGYAEHSLEGKVDLSRAKELYLKSCRMGFGGGCFEAARLTRNEEGEGAQNQALALYREGCDRRHNLSCLKAAAIVKMTNPDDPGAAAEAGKLVGDAMAPGYVQIIQKLPNKH
jgi:TPR repeat protein